MTTDSRITIDVHLSDDEWNAGLVAACIEGLTAPDKHLSPVWFYDAVGSRLFDEITRLPEYYPTRAERSLLLAHGEAIVDAAGCPDTLVELGSGTSDKSRHLLDAMRSAGTLERYVPFDVSESTVRDAAATLVTDYPGLDVHAVIGDFHRHLGLVPPGGQRLVAFLGGTIGNFDPGTRSQFLSDVRSMMQPADRFLLGVDLVKDVDTLVAAYDDAAGVTAAFNRNALANLNNQYGATFDPAAFDHVAVWNEQESWIEMRLRARDATKTHIEELDLTVALEEGEELRTEISAKFTPERVASELDAVGFGLERTWRAEPGFLLALARPVG